MGEYLKVTTANMYIGKAPTVLLADAVETCVTVAIWEPESCIGGMVEVMMPECTDEFAAFTEVSQYADTGIRELVRRLRVAGANPECLEAKVAGGSTLGKMYHEADSRNIGIDNIVAVKRNLEACGIKLISEDIGGDISRRVLFYPANGELIVQSPEREDKVL